MSSFKEVRMLTQQQLLALHYLFPISAKVVTQLTEISPTSLRKSLPISAKKAQQIFHNYEKIHHYDFLSYYAHQHITPIMYTDNAYPTMLLNSYDAPSLLYAKGNINLLQQMAIAIIGSRKAGLYTKVVLEAIIPPLIKANTVIVSGLAKGADTYAHEHTIACGGQTIAVLGHGFYHMYPRENELLAEKIATEHLLLTEFAPHMPPARHHFPMRNRIISGLSQALVVTEAAMRSGTLITTEFALEEGKDVFVVPGPIHSPLSQGTNYLLQEGAIPIINGNQIIDAMQLIFLNHGK